MPLLFFAGMPPGPGSIISLISIPVFQKKLNSLRMGRHLPVQQAVQTVRQAWYCSPVFRPGQDYLSLTESSRTFITALASSYFSGVTQIKNS